jgi:outer membrane protein assembly factor BamB
MERSALVLAACVLLTGCGGAAGAPASPAAPASAKPAVPASAPASASAVTSAKPAASASAPAVAKPAASASTAASTSVSPQATGDWLVYHGNGMHTGVGPSDPALASPKQLWSTPVDGVVYAEPLVAGNRVYVVTENDTAYALDAGSGHAVWQKHVGTPVPGSSLPCGNIDPSGFTATPAIDAGRKELYAVGRFQPTHHELWAFDLDTGNEKYHRTIDPPGIDPRYLQVRSAVALAGGNVYTSFGGNWGDCGPYKGAVVGAKEGDPTGQAISFIVPTQREGAIWATPGPSIDSNGDLLVATGNAASAGDFDYANAVIRLGQDLKMKDYWAPSNWKALSASDTDVGSTSPAILQDDQTFQIGKGGVGYLLKTDKLGNIGGELYQNKICNAAFGGDAYQAPVLYVPCSRPAGAAGVGGGGDTLTALRVSAGRFDVAWQAQGSYQSPIVAYGSVWSINTGTGTLLQLSPADGSVQNRLQLPTPVTAHFLTPTANGGKIFVTSGRNVLAFG